LIPSWGGQHRAIDHRLTEVKPCLAEEPKSRTQVSQRLFRSTGTKKRERALARNCATSPCPARKRSFKSAHGVNSQAGVEPQGGRRPPRCLARSSRTRRHDAQACVRLDREDCGHALCKAPQFLPRPSGSTGEARPFCGRNTGWRPEAGRGHNDVLIPIAPGTGEVPPGPDRFSGGRPLRKSRMSSRTHDYAHGPALRRTTNFSAASLGGPDAHRDGRPIGAIALIARSQTGHFSRAAGSSHPSGPLPRPRR